MLFMPPHSNFWRLKPDDDRSKAVAMATMNADCALINDPAGRD
jgi:hypothetical protein